MWRGKFVPGKQSQQMPYKWHLIGKSQTNIHGRHIRTARVMKTLLKRIFMGASKAFFNMFHFPGNF